MSRIVIIGAGPAGLTAALELLRAPGGHRVTVLEAEGQVGGLSKTIVHSGCRMDLGGHRFFSKDQRVNGWWESLLPLQGSPAYDDKLTGREPQLSPVGPDPETEDRVMLVRRRVSRIYYRGRFFDYPLSLKAETFINLGLITSLRAALSYIYARLNKLPETSLENYYVNHFGRILYELFFLSYTEKLWGRHPGEISADWGSQRVRGLSVWAVVRAALLRPFRHKAGETSLIEEFKYPKYGPGQLWEAAAGEIEAKGGRILTGKTVTKLVAEDKKIKAVLCGQERFDCDILISSMPLSQLVPALDNVPEEILRAAKELPYRDFVTIGLLVNRLSLKNRTKIKTFGGLIPDCWIYVQDRGVKLGRIQLYNNWSPYMLSDPDNTVWLGLEYFCKEGDSLWQLTDEEFFRLAARELYDIGLVSDETLIMDRHIERVKKAYPAYFGSYCEMEKIRGWLSGYSNLYCIGRNGQHRYNNMDHSMLTAFRALDCIKGTGDKAAVWKVNA